MDEPKSTDSGLQETDTRPIIGKKTSSNDRLDGRVETIRKNPWVFAWCLSAVWTILLAVFEDQASNVVLGIPEFRKDFGYRYEGDYVLAASWQSAFVGGPLASRIVGALAAAPIADYMGRRNALIITIAMSIVAITMEIVATTNEVFFGGKILSGVAVAAIECTSGAYLAEIVPTALRGLMTVLLPFAASIASLTAALIVKGTGSYTNRWAYRAVFCSQYGFAAVAVAFVWFMPESPWWLLSKGHDRLALDSLHRLGYSMSTGDDMKRLVSIRVTLEEIRRETNGASYAECFRKSNLRRTIVAITPLTVQTWTGAIFASLYATYYAQLAGYSTDASFNLLITQVVLAMIGNIMSWFLIDRAGRRILTVYGTLGIGIILWIMGGLAIGGSHDQRKGAVAMVLLYFWLYNLTLGATGYTYLTEVATARLRAKTISIGIATQSCSGLMWSFVLPYLFNPDKANLGGKVGFIFGGMAIPCFIFLWCFQPETAGRSYEELDELFMRKVPARAFRSYKTDAGAKERLDASRSNSGQSGVESRAEQFNVE